LEDGSNDVHDKALKGRRKSLPGGMPIIRLTLVALLLAPICVPPASAGAHVGIEPYALTPSYVFDAQSPTCDDDHVACFAMDGSETSVTLSIADQTNIADPLTRPIAGHVLITGPLGFTVGYVCGQGTIPLPPRMVHMTVEIVLIGAGQCTWWDGEDPLANTVTGVPTEGLVVAKFT
jgi:hypothetical protein